LSVCHVTLSRAGFPFICCAFHWHSELLGTHAQDRCQLLLAALTIPAQPDSHILLYSLNMLQAQCELWSGPIAAVAYMPLVKGRLVSMDDAALNGTSVEESKAKLAAFYDAVTHAGKSTDASFTDRSTCNQGFRVYS